MNMWILTVVSNDGQVRTLTAMHIGDAKTAEKYWTTKGWRVEREKIWI